MEIFQQICILALQAVGKVRHLCEMKQLFILWFMLVSGGEILDIVSSVNIWKNKLKCVHTHKSINFSVLPVTAK